MTRSKCVRASIGSPKMHSVCHSAAWASKSRVLLTLREAEELFPQLPCRLQLRPHIRKPPQSKKSRKELRDVPQLLTQYARAGISAFHLGGRKAFAGHQSRAEGELHVQ